MSLGFAAKFGSVPRDSDTCQTGWLVPRGPTGPRGRGRQGGLPRLAEGEVVTSARPLWAFLTTG